MKIYLLMTHELHHHDPQNNKHLASITVITLFYTAVVAAICYLVFGQYFSAILAGTLLGYIIYDLIHYDVHVSNRRNRIFQYLKRYHFSHHYIDTTKGFGLSSPLWDYVFRTKATFISAKQK